LLNSFVMVFPPEFVLGGDLRARQSLDTARRGEIPVKLQS
jgi:hypothetical protein